MFIKSLELMNYRNYEFLDLKFSPGTNILYGDNAQGKTNILEAIYMSATTRSHKGSKDRDVIQFHKEEAHIRTCLEKDNVGYQIDMHLRKNRSKGIAIDQKKLKKAADLLGLLNVVFFSPEDLNIIKNGPAERRRFVDMELCQLDPMYLEHLNQYHKILENRNKLLKDLSFRPELKDTLSVWDLQLAEYGKKIIARRRAFTEQLNQIIFDIHKNLSGQKEELVVKYEPDTEEQELDRCLEEHQARDIRLKQTASGPHRDDFSFMIGNMDVRRFGSQGQQRTAALSLKLSEIELVKKVTHTSPVLLLDDVLSELDSRRQKLLLENIGSIQTVITCTGLDEFVHDRFEIDKVFRVVEGSIAE